MNDFSSEVAHLSPERRALLERLLSQENATSPPEMLPRSRTGDLPLSFAQEQLWFLDQVQPANPAYHIAATVRFRGTLDAGALQQALHALLCRHDILRTTFVAQAGQPLQLIAPTSTLPLPNIVQRWS